MSTASMRAAKALRALKNHRGAVNRAYSAAFTAITHEVRKRTTRFPRGHEHPPHNPLSRLVKRHLTTMSRRDRDDLRDAIKRLYEARTEADDRHRVRISNRDARNALLDARYVMESIGVR